MRPLAGNRLYPPPPNSLEGRPWWNRHQDVGWRRRDGWEVLPNGHPHWASWAPGGARFAPYSSKETPRAGTAIELCAIIDAKWPLPPPPLRAGQVWLLHEGESVATTVVNTTRGSVLDPIEAILLGDQILSRPVAERLLLGEDPLVKAYLIADPVDPNTVPWTGAREG